MTTLQENSIATLEVLRQSDMGVFLNGGTGNTNDDILLHKNQQTGDVKVGDKVTVFLYHDPSGRLTASMRLPKIKVGQIGYAPVINTTRFGAFVDVERVSPAGGTRVVLILSEEARHEQQ